jgi:hypothetical protein
MNASSALPTEDTSIAPRWLLLIHQIPPKPDYFRVKVRRRLQRLGAVALKNSVYVLPNREDAAEDFEWLLSEIVAEGGDATLCLVSFVAGMDDVEVEALFRAERDAEYLEIAREARAIPESAAREGTGGDVARLKRRLAEVAKVDFFGTPARAEAERAVDALDAHASERAAREPGTGGPELRGRTWVTRAGVFVDRIASAWLIRRFIDPEATFKFVPARGYRPASGELRFDMHGAEYTHEGDRCTFETLLARFGLDDPALWAVAEIVHDIDFKDDKFGRPEVPGITSVLSGLALAQSDDVERLRLGAAIFDGLYAQLAR